MSDAKHTPGKLEFNNVHTDIAYVRAVDKTANGVHVVAVCHGPDLAENAARIVACWNACDGLNPEAMPKLVEALQGVIRVADRATVEFDAARAALALAAPAEPRKGM